MVSIWYCFDHAHQQLIRTVITRICSTHIAPPMPCSFVSSAKNFDLDTDSDKGSDSSSHFDPEDGDDAQQTNDISELHDVRLIILSFNDNLTFTHHILLGPQVHSAQTSESDRTVQDTMDKIWYTEGFKMCTCDSKEGQQTVYGLWRQGHCTCCREVLFRIWHVAWSPYPQYQLACYQGCGPFPPILVQRCPFRGNGHHCWTVHRSSQTPAGGAWESTLPEYIQKSHKFLN